MSRATCPVCERAFAINAKSGRLSHHGYRRPGCGQDLGRCFGQHRTPDLETVRAYRVYAEVRGATEAAALETLKAAVSITIYSVFGKAREVVKAEVTGYEWESQHGRLVRRAQAQVAGWASEVRRMNRKLEEAAAA